MLDFKRVNKPDFRYSLLYRYVQFVHNHIYYRRFNIVNKQHIPPRGEGFMVICNHQNGLNDALGILFAMNGRFPVFIARADIFKKEFVGKLLRFLKIMPAFRKRDVGVAGLNNNDIIFAHSARIINEGDIIALFPEAGHEDCHHLGTFKKGFARIAFRAVELSDYKLKLKILPLGNHYSHYFRMQGKLMINIGEPFEFTELYELHKTDPNRAQYLLAQKAREKVQTLMLDIKDLDYYDQHLMLCTIYRDIYIRGRDAKQAQAPGEVARSQKAGKGCIFCRRRYNNPNYFPNELEANQHIEARLQALKEENPSAYEELISKAGQYKHNLTRLKLRDWIFRKRFMVGFWLRTFALLLFSPFWLFGYLNNALPFYAGNLITRKVKDEMLHSSFHLGLGALVTFPLWYLILFATVWILSGTFWIAAIYLASLLPSLLIFFRSKVLMIKLYNRIRRFWLKVRKNPLLIESENLRREIVETMDKLIFQNILYLCSLFLQLVF